MMCNRFAVTLITGLLLGTDTNRTFFFQVASVNFQKKKEHIKNLFAGYIYIEEHCPILQSTSVSLCKISKCCSSIGPLMLFYSLCILNLFPRLIFIGQVLGMAELL